MDFVSYFEDNSLHIMLTISADAPFLTGLQLMINAFILFPLLSYSIHAHTNIEANNLNSAPYPFILVFPSTSTYESW